MRKIYYLSTCDTCRRIIKDLRLKDRNFSFQDIKTENVSPEELDTMKQQTGSYEAIFNKRARKYRQEGWHEKDLKDDDLRGLILKEYTFLRRPVIQLDGRYYIGNGKKTINQIKSSLDEIG